MMARPAEEDPTSEECAELGRRVGGLSKEALQIVASIVGAPSAAHFEQASRRLGPPQLKKLRQDFSKMRA